MRRLLLATLLFALAASGAEAGPLGRGGAQGFGPLRLKIYGFVGDKPEGVAPLTTWTLTASRKKYLFVCDKMEVLSGNASYMDVVNALEPYKPAFRLNGPAAMLKAFTSAAPKQHMVMMGVLTFGGGARILMLESVAPSDATPVP
jgi:hypothetical protein